MIDHVLWHDGRDDYYEYLESNKKLLTEAGSNEQMFARWEYDAENRVVLSEHHGGAEKTSLSYGAEEATVTNDLGKTSIYRFASIAGANRLTEVEGVATPNCLGGTRTISYHPSGEVATKTDWKGVATRYQYNDRGLESSRTEAEGTPAERTIYTDWHPTLNLPVKVTEPGKETTYSYDDQGRLLSRSVNDLPTN